LSELDLDVGFDELLNGLAEISNKSAECVIEDQITRLEEGEVRNCAVLFADIKGFTALSEKLRAEEVKLIIDHLFKILTQEIKRFNGEVDKYMGDCVMAVFGSEISGDNDSEMAIRAGLAMLDRITQINTLLKPKGIELGLRIGINYGEVVYGTMGAGREKDITVMGDTVNTAQRMEANAPINSILITGGTRRYLGDIFVYEERKPIKVKNKVEPVPVSVVEGVNHERTERWQRTSLSGRTHFVGRENEIDKLCNGFRELLSSDAGNVICCIEGHPGIGKSRFAYELRKALDEDAGVDLTAIRSTTPNYATRPYFSVLDILKQYFGVKGSDSADVVREKLESGISALADSESEPDKTIEALPIIGHMLGLEYDDPRLKLDQPGLEAERRIAIRRVFTALAEMEAGKTGHPLVITIDDLQWADDGSLAGLMLVADEVKASLPVYLIVIYRSDFELPEAWAEFPRLTRITLDALTDSDCRKIVESMLKGLTMPKRIMVLLTERSQGNPFFLEEIVHLLVERGIFRSVGDEWRIVGKIDNLDVPVSVNSIVLSRIDRLDSALKGLLQKASVIGIEFSFAVLENVLSHLTRDYDSKDTRNLLDALTEKQMIFRSGEGEGGVDETYIFKNILISETAYNTLLRTNRRTLHRLTAEAIESLFSDRIEDHYAALGHHYERAEEFDRAVDYYELAGKDFALMCRFNDAKRMYSSALKCLKGMCLRKIKDEIWRDRKEIALTLDLLECYNSLSLYREGKVIAERILDKVHDIGTKADLARIYRILGVFAANLGDLDKGVELQDKAGALCREIGDEKTLGRILLTLGRISERRNKWDEVIAYYASALEAAEKGSDQALEGAVHLNRGGVYTYMGRFDEANADYTAALKIFEDIGERVGKARVYANIGIIASMRGRFDEAREHYQKGLEINQPIGNKNVEAEMLTNLGLACFEQGDIQYALQYGEQAKEIYEETGNTEMLGMVLGNIGLAHEYAGDIEKAIECAEASLAHARSANNPREIGLRTTYTAKYRIISSGDESELANLLEGLKTLEETEIAEYIAEGRLNLGQALLKLDRITEARETLEGVVALGSESSLVGITQRARRLLEDNLAESG